MIGVGWCVVQEKNTFIMRHMTGEFEKKYERK